LRPHVLKNIGLSLPFPGPAWDVPTPKPWTNCRRRRPAPLTHWSPNRFAAPPHTFLNRPAPRCAQAAPLHRRHPPTPVPPALAPPCTRCPPALARCITVRTARFMRLGQAPKGKYRRPHHLDAPLDSSRPNPAALLAAPCRQKLIAAATHERKNARALTRRGVPIWPPSSATRCELWDRFLLMLRAQASARTDIRRFISPCPLSTISFCKRSAADGQPSRGVFLCSFSTVEMRILCN